MNTLTAEEVNQVSGSGLSFDEGATLILALEAAGGPLTLAFAIPIAAGLYIAS